MTGPANGTSLSGDPSDYATACRAVDRLDGELAACQARIDALRSEHTTATVSNNNVTAQRIAELHNAALSDLDTLASQRIEAGWRCTHRIPDKATRTTLAALAPNVAPGQRVWVVIEGAAVVVDRVEGRMVRVSSARIGPLPDNTPAFTL